MDKTITINQLKELIKENVNIIDVREVHEYKTGHIPGSINMPLSGFNSTYFNLDKEQKYFIICHSGARSERTVEFLRYQGYNVVDVMGGILGWDDALDFE